MARNEGCCIVKHDLCRTRIYSLWKAMKRRVAVHPLYKNISVCDEWKNDFIPFYKWSMENGYNDSLTLDRINDTGNYEPSNCRWVTMKIQANNTRRNHLITAFGKTQTLQQWSDETGIDYRNIIRRINTFNWSVEKALTTPTRKLERKKNHGSK